MLGTLDEAERESMQEDGARVAKKFRECEVWQKHNCSRDKRRRPSGIDKFKENGFREETTGCDAEVPDEMTPLAPKLCPRPKFSKLLQAVAEADVEMDTVDLEKVSEDQVHEDQAPLAETSLSRTDHLEAVLQRAVKSYLATEDLPFDLQEMSQPSWHAKSHTALTRQASPHAQSSGKVYTEPFIQGVPQPHALTFGASARIGSSQADCSCLAGPVALVFGGGSQKSGLRPIVSSNGPSRESLGQQVTKETGLCQSIQREGTQEPFERRGDTLESLDSEWTSLTDRAFLSQGASQQSTTTCTRKYYDRQGI